LKNLKASTAAEPRWSIRDGFSKIPQLSPELRAAISDSIGDFGLACKLHNKYHDRRL
jgi:hypothetical protein